jgi:alkanesulfonate monooxygenase SsuD/methylene tetrahydromethanopterin reductase-like flavin-dependent oxidoreductase (luciferase family)
MRVSVYLPNWTNGLAWGARPRWPELATAAKDVEAAGCDGLWVADQILQEFEEHDPLEFWDSWTLVAGLASVTERVSLGPLVSSAGFRNPGLLASMASTVAEISGGRAVLALGAGYDEGEHRMFGFPWDRKVSRMEEAAAVLSDLLHEGRSNRTGEWYSTADARIGLPAGVPLIIGTYGIGPRMMRITAEYADGWSSWLAFDDNSPAVFEAQSAELDAACEKVGRDPGAIRRIACLSVHLSEEPFHFGPFDLSAVAIHGKTSEVAERLVAFEGIADEVALYTFPLTPEVIDRLAHLREALRQGDDGLDQPRC